MRSARAPNAVHPPTPAWGHQVEVSSAEEALGVLRRGARQRQRAETGLNYSSSRSHSVFTVSAWGGCAAGGRGGGLQEACPRSALLVLQCAPPAWQVALHEPVDDSEPEEGGEGGEGTFAARLGRMSFVDLAGSERAQRTGNVGVRLK